MSVTARQARALKTEDATRALYARMSEGPFTFQTLQAIVRDSGRLDAPSVDKLIQKRRAAGEIEGFRDGRSFIWREVA